MNLPLAFSSIKRHLYDCFHNIQEQNSIFSKTGSHANPCKFFWRIDGEVAFRQDRLLSMPKHALRRGCKLKWTKQWSARKWSRLHQVLQMQRIMQNLKGYLKKSLLEKMSHSIWKVVVFADFLLLYVYYDFTLVLFSCRNYFIQKLCRKENHKRSFLYFTQIFIILCFRYEIETTS